MLGNTKLKMENVEAGRRLQQLQWAIEGNVHGGSKHMAERLNILAQTWTNAKGGRGVSTRVLRALSTRIGGGVTDWVLTGRTDRLDGDLAYRLGLLERMDRRKVLDQLVADAQDLDMGY